MDSLNSLQDSRRSSCLSTDSRSGVAKNQRRGSHRKSSKKKKKSDKQTLVGDNDTDSDSEMFNKKSGAVEKTTTADVNNQCNRDLQSVGTNNSNNNNSAQGISGAKDLTIKRQNSFGCNSALSPDDSVKSLVSLERKNSLIHEIRVLSPRNSLTGVFYASSVVSVKNPSLTSFKLDELPVTLAESFKDDALLGAPYQAISDANTGETYLMQNTSRKFCIYFDWTDWMSQREEYSLFIFPPENQLRKHCNTIADNTYFDYIVLLFISLNCITLAMERPKIPPKSFEREFLSAANYMFTAVFAMEMLIKVIAKGLFYGKEAYFKNGWNIMDGILVGVSLFDIVLSFFAHKTPRILGILRVFRLLRSLRPLR